MLNEQLQNYIQESIAAGAGREDIKRSLLAAGWQASDIEEAFGAPETPVVIPVPATPPMEPKEHGKFVWIIAAAIFIILIGVGAYLFFAKPRASAPAGQPASARSSSTANVVAPLPTSTPPAPVAATCTDSDASQGANAIYTKGTVTSIDSSGKTQTLTDDCANATYLEEFICYESPVGSGHYASGRQVVKCPNGCLNGACKK